jgi:hypothetical protein
MTTEREMDKRLAVLNQQLLKKLWWCWLVCVGLFPACIYFNEIALASATWTAQYVPSVAKLLHPDMALERLAGKYFGVIALFLPVFVTVLVWREDIRTRFLSTSTKPGKSIAKNLIFVYFAGIPVLLFILAVLYFAPFDMPTHPRLAGQYALHFMIATYPGLLLFGSVLGCSIAVFSALLVGYIWLPFSIAGHHFLERPHNAH